MILLTDEQIYRAIGDNPQRHSIVSATKAGAKAQLRKVVEWIEGVSKAGQPSKLIPSSEWQALLKEVK